jgi:tight adherence protein C
MNTGQMMFLATVFVTVFLTVLLVLRVGIGRSVAGRLGPAASAGSAGPPAAWHAGVARVARPLSRLSVPTEGWESSALRIQFMNAGYRSQSAPAAFFAAKSLLTFAVPLAVMFWLREVGLPRVPDHLLPLVIVASAMLGYFAPNVVLARLASNRRLEIFENFPDAIDLVTICIEAGLGLDAALARVGQEIEMNSAALAEELHLVTLELRAGSTRERALRNLALRTGVEDIDTLVAMLIQADRFGTSISDSLRVHADTLRSKRRQRAEERAAKVPTKLLFPLIFCIFPSMMLVLLGPAFIAIFRTMLPTLVGN